MRRSVFAFIPFIAILYTSAVGQHDLDEVLHEIVKEKSNMFNPSGDDVTEAFTLGHIIGR